MKRVGKTLKNYFIPHEGNDHHPELLRPATVAFVCMVAVVIESFFLFSSAVIQPHSQLFGIIVTNALVDETNEARTTNDVPTLRESPLLDAAAQEKADDMVKNDYFAHTSPAGVSPWYWFQNVGYDFSSAGENLAVNFSDSQDVTDAWLNSPEHRANILNAGFTDIGMATAQGTYDGAAAIYVVELFGTPAIAPLAFVNAAAAQAPPAPATAVTKPAPTEPTSVAVEGASVQAAATGTATATAVSLAPVVTTAPQSNPIQKAASDPRRIVDYLYLGIAILFAAALVLNIFIKIRIQYPQLIFGGMLVILVAGLFIVLNQHVGLVSPVIL